MRLYFARAMRICFSLINKQYLMKTTMYLAVLAMLFSSCKKSAEIVPDLSVQPNFLAKIFTSVNEPRDAVLGDAATFFIVGEKVTIYIPYENSSSDITMATFNLLDEAGEVITSMDITESKNSAEGLNIPSSLQGTNFLHATIDMKEEFAGKTLSIQTQVSDGRTVYEDYLYQAFNVMF
jgi:hypothetical protein